MLISLCIPCHNRTYDLKRTMPYLLDAASYSPPVEIVVVDYNSPDDLSQYMKSVMVMPKGDGVSIVYRKYTGRDYYHMAHARNLSVLASSGEYFVILSADIWIEPDLIAAIRERLMYFSYDWLECYGGVIVCRRQEFIDAGGYDERFELYGPEDRDLNARLRRRGGLCGKVPGSMVHIIQTPKAEKVGNYRINSLREASALMHPIFDENERSGVLVANAGERWGQWQ